MTDASKREKEKKRFSDKVENTVSFFAVFLCVIMVIMEVIDAKKRQETKGDQS